MGVFSLVYGIFSDYKGGFGLGLRPNRVVGCSFHGGLCLDICVEVFISSGFLDLFVRWITVKRIRFGKFRRLRERGFSTLSLHFLVGFVSFDIILTTVLYFSAAMKFLVQMHMFFNDPSDEVSYCDGVFCGCGHLNKYSANSRSSDSDRYVNTCLLLVF
ncbi:hypothetical protein MTR67_018463 [Solanum verrucosum]|uniref:Uncharacterized protein n=1 Tax=Solanum verrucosum TaxID=315347 RepID=A0AAF0QL13_SOLVR|nr:hypothetical protein MTR67_018463 [Solanum verrucosum]